MRLRTLSAVAVAVLAAAGLAGCRTNVGLAATVDGQRYTETQVNDYLTPSAKQASASAQGYAAGTSVAAMPPRSFVVSTLIQDQFFAKLLAATPSGAPSDGRLSSIEATALAGHSVHATAVRLGVVGYSSTFESKYLDFRVRESLLGADQQRGIQFGPIIKRLKFPVSVNPRYGAWDPSTSTFSAAAGVGLPGFLNLQSTASTASTGS